MSKSYKFSAVIKSNDLGGAFVEIPFDVEKEFGKKRIKIKALIETEIYRGTLVRMGTECHLLGVRKDIREKINKEIGDKVNVVVEEDLEPRIVEIPEDVQIEFEKDLKAKAAYDKLSYTHKKEYINSIVEARKPETRKSRIEKMISSLKNK